MTSGGTRMSDAEATTAVPAEEGAADGRHPHGAADEIPEVDARLIPMVVRQGALLGALGDVRPGGAMIISAPHDPFPLLASIDEREGENVRYSYVQRGPDVWRVLLERVA